MALRKAFPSLGSDVSAISILIAKPRLSSEQSQTTVHPPSFAKRFLCTSQQATPFEKLTSFCRELTYFTDLSSLVQWDERVMMPPNAEAAKTRGLQKAVLAKVIHEKSTSEELRKAISDAKKKLLTGGVSDNVLENVTVREADRNYNLLKDVPLDLVSEIAERQTVGRYSWAEAKKKDNYEMYRPDLATMLSLQKAKAVAMNGEQPTYDTMLGIFERGMTADRLSTLFGNITEPLGNLINEVLEMKSNCNRTIHPALVGQEFDLDKQLELMTHVVGELGFDKERGRIDLCPTPFAAPAGYDDVRISTVLFPDNLYRGLKVGVHESGHAMYEQGKNRSYEGLPAGQALSIGAHESQSLFYERMVSRNLPFFEAFLPKIHELFPRTIDASAEDMYFAFNQVDKGPIRSVADELTYPLHIILRFEIEKKMFDESLDTEEFLKRLPTEWNEKMDELLGVTVEKVFYLLIYLLGTRMIYVDLNHHTSVSALSTNVQWN